MIEAVGFDGEQKYKPFRTSLKIKRKYDIEKLEKLPIELNVFDIIYYNGESLIEKPFIERRKVIEKITKVVPYKIKLAEQIITDSEEEAEKFYNLALEDGQEGVMVKNLQAIYKPGARIGYAVKLKPDARELDLVITGAEWGTGKRAGWLTSFDVSCRDENDELLEVGKVSTGLKEKKEEGLSFEDLTELLKPLITKEDGKKVFVNLGCCYDWLPKYQVSDMIRYAKISPIIRLRPDGGLSDVAVVDDLRQEAGVNALDILLR